MQIFIEFDSIWQNSFLFRDYDKIPKGKKIGDFKATSKNDKIDHKGITKNTILGILSRLIGDQRKLHDAKASDDYYFKDKEHLIGEPIVQLKSWDEKVYLKNKSEDRPPEGSYLGVIQEDEKFFYSEDAYILWSILYMDIDELLEFILSDKMNEKKRGDTHPHSLLQKAEKLKGLDSIVLLKDEIASMQEKFNKKKENFDEKAKKYSGLSSPTDKEIKTFSKLKEKIEKEEIKLQEDIDELMKQEERVIFDKKLHVVLDVLTKKFPQESKNNKYYNKVKIYPMSLYASALYLQLERMKNNKRDIEYFFTQKGTLQGFSKSGFNGVRDFLNKLAGNHKKLVGTPSTITKSSGELIITLNIKEDEAEYLKEMIDNAGVSSFYLGKKGLAYVTDIITEEED